MSALQYNNKVETFVLFSFEGKKLDKKKKHNKTKQYNTMASKKIKAVKLFITKESVRIETDTCIHDHGLKFIKR